jgi:hypothetical protein
MKHGTIRRPARLPREIIATIEHEYPLIAFFSWRGMCIPRAIVELPPDDALALRTAVETRIQELVMSHAQAGKRKEVQL